MCKRNTHPALRPNVNHSRYNSKVPVMIGSNRDEMAFFDLPPAVPADLDPAGFRARVAAAGLVGAGGPRAVWD